MEVVMSIILSIVIICIILIWYISLYNRFQEYIIRINEAEASIDSTLRKRFDLLNKSTDIIRVVIKKEDALDCVLKLRSQKLNNFELDRKIYDAINEFNKYKEESLDLKKNEGFIKIDVALNETEAEIVASRKYYNDIITDYNKMIKQIPSNFIAKCCRLKIKNYFDGKNFQENGKAETKI
ncbi:MAG: LemA family protein [Bacilli bacterium]